MIGQIIFGNEDVKRKRIAIRKLKSRGLDNKFVKMFIRLLEYVSEI